MSDDVMWFTDVTLELCCSTPGCDNHRSISQATRKEVREQAKAEGWRFGKNVAACPDHAKKGGSRD